MFAVLVAIVLLAAAVGAIYLLLKSMGQDGVEVAAPGSCKSGRCGVRNGAAAGCRSEAEPAAAETLADGQPAAAEAPDRRPG